MAVYVREAHPADGWGTGVTPSGVIISQPKTLAQRNEVAKLCCSTMAGVPMVVDTMDDRVAHAYCGRPDRLYVIDRRGHIAYKGGRGGLGFKPIEMEQSLIMLLLEEQREVKKR